MKKILYNAYLVLFLIMGISAAAGNPVWNVQKEKTINKVYIVNPDAGINITNKYGHIYVTTWNEDKVALDIVIKVRGKNEDKVNSRLNTISIDINALKHMVSAKTVIGSDPGSTSMEINYTIKIPKRGSIILDNQYGNIVIDKIQEMAEISCKYGNVTIAELQGNASTIKLKYCDKSTIGYMKSGTIDAKYSGINLTKTGNLKYVSEYTNLTAKEIANLQYNSRYGDINVTTVSNVEGSGNYMGLKVGNLENNLKVSATYSNVTVNNINSSANNIQVETKYTNVNLQYDPDYTFDYEFDLKYADLKAPGLTTQTKSEKNTSLYQKGFYKSAGKNRVTINSNYGNVKVIKN